MFCNLIDQQNLDLVMYFRQLFKYKSPECVKSISTYDKFWVGNDTAEAGQDTLQSLACWNVALNWSIGSSYRPVDFLRGAAIVSEFEWAESVEVALLTTVELQRQLYFCRCSHSKGNVTNSETLWPTVQGSSLGLSMFSGTNLTCV